MRLIAIDPGASAGVAVFADGKLVEVRRVKVDATRPVPLGLFADELVIEMPMVYPTSGNPASIVKLAFVAGKLAEAIGAPKTRLVTPREWKGQRPKEIDQHLTVSLLDIGERGRLTVRNSDVLDAVGLGLWALGRR